MACLEVRLLLPIKGGGGVIFLNPTPGSLLLFVGYEGSSQTLSTWRAAPLSAGKTGYPGGREPETKRWGKNVWQITSTIVGNEPELVKSIGRCIAEQEVDHHM